MLDAQKMREIRAIAPGLEIEESSWPTYERLVILRALEFFQELQEAGGLPRFIQMADRAEPAETYHSRRNVPHTPTVAASSEFLEAVDGKDPDEVWAVLDDHMATLRQLNERAYNSILRKIREI